MVDQSSCNEISIDLSSLYIPFLMLLFLFSSPILDCSGSGSGVGSGSLALWSWRDVTARAEDESLHYIMSNAELVRFGEIIQTQRLVSSLWFSFRLSSPPFCIL